ncbi:hypothetical protein [Patulibacter minatonensis]|uniref:hypothetical protein n=1 Tax=Patulibacter minatonensis TaxID=298163 RepID=UPI00047C1784|nr:hypothetical protein [Patulibacter minatonensis]
MHPHRSTQPRSSRPARRRRAALIAGAALGVTLVTAGAAQAYEIDNFSANIVKADGTTFESQAGGHPYQGIISFDTKVTKSASPAVLPVQENGGATSTIRTDTPPGLVPNPQATPKCAEADLEANSCAPASQIGTVVLRLRTFLPTAATTPPGGTPLAGPGSPFGIPAGGKGTLRVKVGLYNMETTADAPLARFSFNPKQAPGATGEPVDIVGHMRPDDNGLYFVISNVSNPTTPATPTLTGSTLTFWGTPGAASHNSERGAATLALAESDTTPTLPSPPYPAGTPLPLPYTLASRAATGATGITDTTSAFLRSPTSCTGPSTATLTLDSYQGDHKTADFAVGASTNGLQGCDQVPFASTTTFDASSMQRDAPTPLGVQLDVPQSTDTGTLGTADVKRVAVTLPPGMTISPSAANGLEACTDDQFHKGTTDAIACPAASRIGATSITSPLLDSPLTGSVHVGQPLSGNRYRLFVNADGHGISIRLKGTVTPDPVTGQVSAVFDDNPQLPFSRFRLDFDGGARAIIASPQACGTATGSGTLSSWSGGAASATSSSVDVVACGGNPFGPSLTAALATPQSGKYAPATVTLGRPDGDQFLSGLKATLPAGMTARIKGITPCSEAQIGAESCPDAARIATVRVQAGPGSAPYALTGSAYLTNGYKGGAFGSVAIIHAVAGPYDLGNVVVRQALRIDPKTAQVTVDSDPLPQIKEGIVLRLRNLTLDVNRADFLRNPTSCGTANITSTLTGIAGGIASPSAPVAFSGCQTLPFRPKIALAFGNRSQMKKGGHPQVKATVTQFESEAGIKSAEVALPKQVALQASNAQSLCEKADAAKDACPKTSIVGSATAETTILNRKLFAPIYFVKGTRRTAAGKEVPTLPTLYIPLDGEARVNLRAVTSVSRDRLVTTFPSIPDQPIKNFAITIDGGKHGIIAATRDLCTAKAKASTRFGSWSGKKAPTRSTRIGTACKVAKKK